jgi:hypothetical protein
MPNSKQCELEFVEVSCESNVKIVVDQQLKPSAVQNLFGPL